MRGPAPHAGEVAAAGTARDAFGLVAARLAAGMRRRLIRLLLSLPIVLPVALALAPRAAPHWGIGYPAAALGLTALLLLVLYGSSVVDALACAVLGLDEDHDAARAIEIGADIAAGAVIGRMLAAVLTVDLVTAIGVGAAIIPLYNVLTTKLVLGELGEGFAKFLLMPTGIRPDPQYSQADALAAQGRYDDALTELERWAAAAPADARPLLHGARMLRHDAGRSADAVVWLRRARERLGQGSALHATVSREIAELLLYTLCAPQRAGFELARLADLHRDTPAGQWAAAELRILKDRSTRKDVS